MKRLDGLFDEVVSFRNLLEAVRLTLRGHRYKPAAARFWLDLENEIFCLQDELRTGIWRPRPYRIFTIYERKPRQICASEIRDRVVHHAVCRVLDPISEKRLISDTFACRVGKGTHAAINRAQAMMRRSKFSLQCDISKYFASIDHALLKKIYRRMVKDQQLLDLLDLTVDHAVPGSVIGKGMPIGNLTSQYFANLYLGELDHFIKDRLRVRNYLRYMDDWLIFGDDKVYLHRILSEARNFLEDRLRLRLKERVIRIAPISEGMTFLGFRIHTGTIRIAKGRIGSVRRTIRAMENRYLAGEIDEGELSRSVSSRLGHWRASDTLKARRELCDRLMIRG